MNTINPTITIQNTAGNNYLVRLQHDFGNGEMLDCTIRTEKHNQTLGQISNEALTRLEHLVSLIKPTV